jgi:hypothetical protein
MRRSVARTLLLGGLLYTCGLTAAPVQPKNPPPFNDHTPSQKAHDHGKPAPPIFLFGNSDSHDSDEHWTAAHKNHGHHSLRDPHHKPSWDDITAIPEPATYALLGAGMIALSLLRKKRRSRA